MLYLVWVHQLITKTICSRSRHEYAGTCRNVECPLVKLVGESVGGRVSAMCHSIFGKSVTGKTCGDSVLEVAAFMYSIVCVETIQM